MHASRLFRNLVTILVFFSGLALHAAEGDVTSYLPGAAESAGQGGARFASTLVVTNTGDAAATVRIGLIPAGGKAAPPEVQRSIAAGETQRISSALSTLFGPGYDAGTLTVTSAAPLVLTLATQNVANPSAAYGLALLPVSEASLLTTGLTGHAIWASQSADPATGSRTNVAVTLVDPGSSATVRVYDDTGALRGSTTVSSDSPTAWQARLVDITGGTALTTARVEIAVTAGRATGYTVVNDNVTSDAIASQVEVVGSGPTDRIVDGVAKTPGLAGAFWSSDVRLFNPGSTAVDVTLIALGFAPSTFPVTINVPAHGLVEIDNVLSRFSLPDGVAGALRVQAPSPVLVAARTVNRDPSGTLPGTFSSQQFVLDLASGMLGEGARGYFVGIDQSFAVPGVRTNLALFGGPSGAQGRLVLRDETGTQRAAATFHRGPFEWGQQNVADWFPSLAGARSQDGTPLAAFPSSSRIDVEVDNGSLDGYVSRIDNASGDPVTCPVTPDPAHCGVPPFSIDPFTVTPSPLALGANGTLTWDYQQGGSPVNVSSQEIAIDGGTPVSLQNQVRTYQVSFSTVGTHHATLTARKGCRTETRTIDVYVCGDLDISPDHLPDARSGQGYSQTLTSTGDAPLTWTRTGSLPSGITFNAATATLAGIPKELGTFTSTYTVTDAHGCTGTKVLPLRVLCGAITVSPSTLPNGVTGSPYGPVNFSRSGGVGSGTWSTSGALPAGLTLSSAGILSGTPTASGTFTVTFVFTDSLGCTGSRAITFTICNPITVLPASLPAGTATVAYSQTLTQTGGTGATTFAVTSGALPAGLSLSPAGVLSGTPTVTGTFNFTVTATDSLGCTGATPYTLTINCPTITIAPTTLANGTAGVAYASVTFTRTGGVAGPTAWSISAGALPAGMSLSAAGVLSGTPTVTGTFNFTVQAADPNNCLGTQALSLTVDCPTITVNPASLANATAGVAYTPVTFTQTGGVGAIGFSISAGALPAGMSLSGAGVLSGTPTVTGPFNFTVMATDANGCTGTRAVTLTVDCPTITVSPASLANATAGVAYTPVTFTQTGGVGTITWSVSAGALPAGMSLNPGTGVLSGTPTVTGTFNFTVMATDANGCTGTRALALTVDCPTITVSPASVPAGVAGSAYAPVTFTQTGGVGTITWSVSAGTLPAGMSLNPGSGVLSGTPTQTGTFNIVVTATDANGCTGNRPIALTILCPTINVLPASLPNGIETIAYPNTQFTQSGAIGTTIWSVSAGTLPTGLSFSATGLLSGTPAAGTAGSYGVTFQVMDQNGCIGTMPITFRICPDIAPTITPTSLPTAPLNAPYGPFTFAQTASAATPVTWSVTSGTLPNGITLDTNTGVLSGTPTASGTSTFTVTATDANGCTGSVNLSILVCPTITVTNPAVTSGVAGSFFSQTFTQSGGIGTTTFSTASTLPTGLSLSSAGVLSGTPTQTGTFPIVVTATDSNGCTGSGSTYNLVITCQTITVTNPATNTGTAGSPFSQTFTQSGAIGTATFSTASTLPAGLSLSSAGVLSGTPTVVGTFPIVVTVTDANGCTGSGATYNLVINCQTITVTNPATASGAVNAPFSQTFTQSGAIGTATFSTVSTLPAGLSLSSAGVLSGTPTQTGTFPIVVTVTDANGCTGTGAIYNLVIGCQTITVTNPAVTTGTVTVPFSQNFTQSGAIGTATFSTASTLPTGLSLSSAGVLSGTPTQSGTFPITVTVTDSNGCTGTGPTYTLVISCQAMSVGPSAIPAATSGVSYSASFTSTGGVGTVTLGQSGTLPTGISFSAGALTGTPTQTGAFPITITATDQNGCSASHDYLLVVSCAGTTISLTPGSLPVVDVNTAYPGTTFGATGGTGPYSFLEAGALPAGMTFSGGVLSGTPTVSGVFPITVSATDFTGCAGLQDYLLVVSCAGTPITVTPASLASGTVGTAYPTVNFGATGGAGGNTFTEAGTLPAGMTFAGGVLSGTPTQAGTFAITVAATDSASCSGATGYSLVIVCPTITVTNPGVNTGTAGTAFSQTFTQTGAVGTVTWSESGALPSGITLNSATGVLSGTTTQVGTFPITVTATDANGCTGSSSYTLAISCQTITVTNPGVNTGTAGQAFSQTFTVSGILGTVTWSATGTLPTGITLNSATGVLSGTTSQVGTFPLTVTATDSNGCFGTSSYTLTINCQTITVTNPATTQGTAGIAFSQTFTASGILGTATWSESGTLPAGLSFNTSTGVLSGTPTQTGSFPITVTVTDTNGCTGTGAQYSLTIICPTITVTRTGGGAFPQGTFNVTYTGQSVTGTGSNGTPLSFAITSGALPTGLSLSSAGALSGTPSATGTFAFTVTATDSYSCTGSQSFTIAIAPNLGVDSYSNLVNNTQEVITGGLTSSPSTPFTFHSTKILANDTPSGGVTLTTGTFATTGGGAITIASDGTFIYTPPVTNLASDTYTYTASSDTGGTGTPVSATATITFTLTNRVWYVNPGVALSGNGQSQSPFNNTNLIPASPTLANNDIVFVYNGSAASAVSKIDLSGGAAITGVQLVGQGVALVVNSFTLVSAGTAPTITNSSGAAPRDVVKVGSGDTITGVTLTSSDGNATAASLVQGTNPAGLTISSATLSTTGGSTAHGINLSGATGTVTVSNVTLGGTGTGDMVRASTGTAQWNFTGSPITQTGGRALNASGKTGGGMSFDAASTLTVSAGTTDGGITLSSNSGGETFTFNGKIAVTTTGSARGFVASTSGTVVATDTTSTLSSASGAALDFQNTTIGGANLTFRSISATSPTTSGIILNNTGSSGGLKVLGNSSGNCGGSITVQPLGTPSTANAPVTGDCTGGTITGGSPQISLVSTAKVSLTRMFLQNAGTDGINAQGVSDLTIDHSYITDSAGAAQDRGIEIGDFSTGTAVNGTITISNSTIGPTPHDNIGVGIGSGTSTWSITNTVLTGSVQNSGFNFEVRNATVSSFLMDGCILQNQFADGMQMNPASGVAATITSATIQNSTFVNNNIHMDLNHDGTSNVTYKVLNNTFQFSTAQAVNFFTSASPGTGGTANGRFVNNRVGNAANFLSGGGMGFRVNVNGGAAARVLLDSNVIRQEPNGRGIEIVSRNGTGGTDATVTNNDVDTQFVATVQNGGFSLSNIFLQSNCLTVCNTLRSNITGNVVPATPPNGELVAGQLVLIRNSTSTNQLVDVAPASPDALSELTSHNTGSVATSGTITLIAGPINTPP